MAAQLVVALVSWALLCAAAYGVGLAFGRGDPMRSWLGTRLGRGEPETPAARPIEAIAADLQRLGSRFHHLYPGTSFAKTEAVRTAYDRALADCCSALGLTHLLGVIPSGPELDAERERVERQLASSGVQLPLD